MERPAEGTFWADPAHFAPVTRRELLRVGFVGTVGLTLGQCFRLQSAAAQTTQPAGPAAESVILIYLDGGMSHIDSFDPKPNAPIEIRGEFNPINTKVEGMQLCGLWEHT